MKKPKKTPMRMCVACQSMKPKSELMRVVADKEGNRFIDTSGRMAGRGAYLCRTTACIEKALKERRLERALKGALPEGFADELRRTAEDA